MATSYVQKPVTVQAVQYDGSNQQEVIDFTNGKAKEREEDGAFVLTYPGGDDKYAAVINTTDWLVKDAWDAIACRTNADFQIIWTPAP